MTTFDPFKGLDRVREYQERVVVQAVRLMTSAPGTRSPPISEEDLA